MYIQYVYCLKMLYSIQTQLYAIIRYGTVFVYNNYKLLNPHYNFIISLINVCNEKYITFIHSMMLSLQVLTKWLQEILAIRISGQEGSPSLSKVSEELKYDQNIESLAWKLNFKLRWMHGLPENLQSFFLSSFSIFH